MLYEFYIPYEEIIILKVRNKSMNTISMGRIIINKVIAYINKAREMFPEVTDDMLCGNGAIYYMNGNDGTEFDWNVNDMCCEFYLFYKETEMGFIKVYVNKDNTISGYAYNDKGNGEAIKIKRAGLIEGEAYYLASVLKKEADDEGIYDEDISKINFDSEMKDWEYIYDYD